MNRPIRFSDIATDIVLMVVAFTIGYGLDRLGVPKWLCWSAFGAVLFGRVVHGWITTRRRVPAGPMPLAVRGPLDVLTIASLWGALAR
jgi:hypothetical protein